MYLHKIKLISPFDRKRLGNSLTWEVSYDGEELALFHRSGRTYCRPVKPPAFVGVDISGEEPRVFPIKKPRDVRRALLWEIGFRKRSEVNELPSYEKFEGRYCFVPREGCRDTLYFAPHFVYRSDKLFMGLVPEAVMYRGFRRTWWMAPDCTLEEVHKAVAQAKACKTVYVG